MKVTRSDNHFLKALRIQQEPFWNVAQPAAEENPEASAGDFEFPFAPVPFDVKAACAMIDIHRNKEREAREETVRVARRAELIILSQLAIIACLVGWILGR